MEGLIYALALLACPVGMGLMMWFMGKGMNGKSAEKSRPESTSLADLRAEQERIAAEIDRLDRKHADSEQLARR